MNFVPLHIHTTYGSVLDSIIRPNELVDKVASMGCEACAITDHGSMAAVIMHYKACKKKGIKPIIGLEVYMTDDVCVKDQNNRYSHLILLAKNNTGYLNLKKLSSFGYLNGFYYKPRIDRKTLEAHKDGLICMSACLAGEVAKKIMREEEPTDIIEYYYNLFGDDYYLEIQAHESKDQILVNQQIVDIAEEFMIPVVATTDAHYLSEGDADAHEVYINISQDRDTESYKDCYVQTYDEMLSILQASISREQAVAALENTNIVADKCNVEIDLGHSYLPAVDVPPEFKDETEYMKSCIKEGIIRRGINKKPNYKEYAARVKFEFNVICTKGFQGYFLILKDLINRAKERGIPIGPGRGSAGNCLITFLMGITDIDPVLYGLDFSRFLTIQRTDLPDVDSDVSTSRRSEFIDLIADYYGQEYVAQNATFGTLASKECLDSVGRVMKIDRSVVDEAKKNLSETEGVKSIARLNKSFYEKNKAYIDMCCRIEGLPRSEGCHAGAVCIAGNHKPMVEYAPVRYNKDNKITTQFEMHDAQAVSLVKFDMLGLGTLDVIADAAKLAGFDYYSFNPPLDDKETYDMVSAGDTSTVFQAESGFMTNVFKLIKPQNIEEWSACIAIGRPDTIKYLEPYYKRKFGMEEITYIHPELEPILAPTYGCIIYQEQILSIVKHFGGFTDGEADKFRKAIGKVFAV